MALTRQLVSVTATNTLGNNASGAYSSATVTDNATHLDVSFDGRYIAFESIASNFSGSITDNNAVSDVFVKDMLTGALTLVSANTNGSLLSGNLVSISPEISDNGQFVVFQLGLTAQTPTIYQKNLSTNALTVVSVSFRDGSNIKGEHPTMSADGRYVVFDSKAQTDSSGTDGQVQVFLKDTQTAGNSVIVSQKADGTIGNSESSQAHIADNGQFVVFESTASNLFDSDTNGKRDILLKDLTSNAISAVTLSKTGVLSNGNSENPMLSKDGRYVVFESLATNLIDGKTLVNNAKYQIFRKDLVTGDVTLVSVKEDGVTLSNNQSFKPMISADGRFVVFCTGTNSGFSDNLSATIFLKDLQTGKLYDLDPTFTASLNANVTLTYFVDQYSFSADGHYLFLSTKQATTLNSPIGSDATLNVYRYDLNSITGAGGSVESDVTRTLTPTETDLTLTGTSNINGTGNESANNLTGNTAKNILDAKGGADTLDGSAGADTLKGGKGNDEYHVEALLNVGTGKLVIEDAIIENASEGTDTIILTYSGEAVPPNVSTFVLAPNVENLDAGGLGAEIQFNLTGNALANLIYANNNDNMINGGAGADSMYGEYGNDTYTVDNQGDVIYESLGDGGSGIDTVLVSIAVAGGTYTLSQDIEHGTLINSVAFNLVGNDADNNLKGNALGNLLSALAGDDTLDGGAGADTLVGGAGDDVYYVDNVGDKLRESSDSVVGGIDLVISSVSYSLVDTDGTTATDTLGGGIENITLAGTLAINATGSSLGNIILGNNAINILEGKGGADTMDGGNGSDIYIVADTADKTGAEIQDTGSGLTDQDELRFSSTVVGGQTLTLDAGDTGLERIVIGTGVAAAAVTTGTLNHNVDASALTNAISILGNAGKNSLTGTDFNDTLDGGAGDDNLLSGKGNDSLLGGAGKDTLQGGDNNDTLDGGTGADSLDGGDGNNLFVVDDAGDVVVAGVDTDTVQSKLTSFDLSVKGANVENLLYMGVASKFTGTGNDLGNSIVGGAAGDSLSGGLGDDTLVGGAGADTLIGGAGDDVYYVDSVGDKLRESSDAIAGGIDMVISSVSYSLIDTDGTTASDTLGGGIENITLTGSTAINATGNSLDNIILGNNAINVLEGKGGADTMDGGNGSDIYIVADTADKTGAEIQDTGSGLTDKDELRFSSTVVGGQTLTLDAGDTGLERIVIGTGVAAAAVTTGILNHNVDASALTNAISILGNAGKNSLTGTDFNDTLDGGAGDDNLLSGKGNDSLLGGAGKDTLQGGDNNDTLDGGTGADSLDGGDGNNLFVVDDAGDVVVAGVDTDTVQSKLTSFDLSVKGANVENLLYMGVASKFTGTGNDLGNSIVGGAAGDSLSGGLGDDTLVGGAGADTLIGGAGDDVYYVDSVGDKLRESSDAIAGGIDMVISSVSYSLIDTDGTTASDTLGGGIENITLVDTKAINATGNNLGNIIFGNNAINVLEGKGGADTMDGGNGSDIYLIADTADKTGAEIQDTGSGLTDKDELRFSFSNTVVGGQTLTLDAGDTGLERIVIGTGVAAAAVTTGTLNHNVDASALTNAISILGNAGKNSLTGTDFNDTLDGGAGDDNLLSGKGNDSLLGGAGKDTLQGGDNNDTLDGGTGADSLDGGDGNNLFVVDDAGDVVVAGVDTDTVQSKLTSFDLSVKGANVENLLYMGVASKFTGTGNDLGNSIVGGAAGDSLSGGLGDDTLVGGAGADTLVGGEGGDWLQGGVTADVLTGGVGADTFVFDTALTSNVDVITDFVSGTDQLILDQTIFTAIADLGSFSATSFRSGSTAPSGLDADDRLYYNTATGDLYYDKDGSGAALAVKFTVLTAHPTLAATDISVIA